MGADRLVAVCGPGRGNRVLEQPRGLSRDVTEPGMLIGVEDAGHPPVKLIQRRRCTAVLSAGQQGG